MALTKAEQEELELLELEEQEAQHLANQKKPEKEEPSSGIDFLKLISNPAYYISNELKPENVKTTLKSVSEQLPTAGAIIGGTVATPSDVVLGPLGTAAGAGLGAAGGQFAKEMLSQLVFDGEQKGTEQILKEAGKEGAISAATDLGGGVVLKGLSKIPFGQWLKKQAGGLAELATGETGKKAEKFEEGSGEKLLEEKLVRFGDSPADIAQRVYKKMRSSSENIDKILSSPEAQKIKIDENQILKPLEDQIAIMNQSGSQVDAAARLQSYIDNVRSAIQRRGSSELTPLAAEMEKRGWNKSANMWVNEQAKPELKAMYGAYKDAAEKSLGQISPEVQAAFKENKAMYGLLNPIEQAASKRASQQAQSPLLGLLDTTAGLYGLSDPHSSTGKVALAMAGRRFIAPRIASSVAVPMYSVGKAITEKAVSPVVKSAAEYGLGNALTPLAESLFQQQQVEQPTDRAERINQERKVLRGK